MAIRCIAFAMLVLAGILVLGNLPGISAQCRGNLSSIISECNRFVQKEGPIIPPSQACCGALKDADLPCLCRYVTPAIEAMISMEKAVYVARACGNTVPSGAKCGSYTIPPKA